MPQCDTDYKPRHVAGRHVKILGLKIANFVPNECAGQFCLRLLHADIHHHIALEVTPNTVQCAFRLSLVSTGHSRSQ